MIDSHIKGPALNGYGAITAIRALHTLFGKATGVLLSDATAPSDGDTVTIGAKVYTFKTALTPTEGQVLIGANAAAAMANLKSAIMHTGTPGTDYSVAAANTDVSATSDATHVYLTALRGGTAGNSIATTEAGTHTSFGAATLTGGIAGNATEPGRRLLLSTNGATIETPIEVDLYQLTITAFDGTAPVVSIQSEDKSNLGAFTNERVIADGATEVRRIITADKNYYVLYTAGTAGPTVGNIWSFAKVAGIGTT